MGKLPEDYRVDALALEADRRGKLRGRPYSYGQLVADTTYEERSMIERDYLRRSERRDRRKFKKGL